MEELYKNIRKYRQQRKLTQAQLAKMTGYTDRSSIAKIEKGVVDIPQSKIELFAQVLGVTAGELMGYNPDDETATLAAHHEKEDFTEAELAEIEEFKKYVLSKRKNND